VSVSKWFVVSTVAAVAMTLTFVRALYAECPNLTPTEALKHAPIGFVGDLVQVDKWGLATVRVIERLKGKIPNEVVVRDGVKGLESWPVFTQPGRYLVFMQPCDPTTETGWPPHDWDILDDCPETRLLSSVNAKELLALRRYVHANRKTLAPGESK
jgi:hypothetical protein